MPKCDVSEKKQSTTSSKPAVQYSNHAKDLSLWVAIMEINFLGEHLECNHILHDCGTEISVNRKN